MPDILIAIVNGLDNSVKRSQAFDTTIKEKMFNFNYYDPHRQSSRIDELLGIGVPSGVYLSRICGIHLLSSRVD